MDNNKNFNEAGEKLMEDIDIKVEETPIGISNVSTEPSILGINLDTSVAIKLLDPKGMRDLSSSHNFRKVDPIEVDPSKNIMSGLDLSKIESGNDEDSIENIKVINTVIESVVSLKIGDKVYDISMPKNLSIQNQHQNRVSLAVRLSSRVDTRNGTASSMTVRGKSGKTKEEQEVVLSITGVDSASDKMLDMITDMALMIRNIILGNSYELIENGKEVFLNNFKYSEIKSIVYNQGIEDLAELQNMVAQHVKFIDIGTLSADFSSYASYAVKKEDVIYSDFGDVMENEKRLKNIKEHHIGEGNYILSRKCPSYTKPAKATYPEEFKEEIQKISKDLQVLQVLVVNCISYSEFIYNNPETDLAFNEKETMDTLQDNFDKLSSHKYSTMDKLEKSLGVTIQDKIDISMNLPDIIKEAKDNKMLEMANMMRGNRNE